MINNPLEADEEAFKALSDAYCDFSKEHIVDFLFLGDETNLGVVRNTLEDLGFFVKEPQNPGQLLIHNKMILTLPIMQSLTVELEKLALTTQTSYDGWGTTTKGN